MKSILIDSGPLIALFDASDKHHQASVSFIRANKNRLVTTLASVTETLHMLDFNRQAQLDFLEWMDKGAVEVRNIENCDFGRIRELTEKYQDLPMDFADSCLVYLAEKLGLDAVATVDRDFSIYRINGRKKFKMALS
jgi:predicted nucleic acid-binding protein